MIVRWIALLMLLAPAAEAQILGDSARQMPENSVKLVAYYQGMEAEDLNFAVGAAGTCSTSNGVPFPCNASGNIAAQGSGGAGMLKLIYQPGTMFQYFAAFGEGNYSLSIPSTTVMNVLTGGAPGLTLGAGVKAVIYPDTIVTPAAAFEVSVWQSRYSFSGISSGGVLSSASEDLNLMQYQAAFETSHQFHFKNVTLDPYGGVKWIKTQTELRDMSDGSQAGGQEDVVTPYLGMRVPVNKTLSCFAEASFIGGYEYSAGVQMRLR